MFISRKGMTYSLGQLSRRRENFQLQFFLCLLCEENNPQINERNTYKEKLEIQDGGDL